MGWFPPELGGDHIAVKQCWDLETSLSNTIHAKSRKSRHTEKRSKLDDLESFFYGCSHSTSSHCW